MHYPYHCSTTGEPASNVPHSLTRLVSGENSVDPHPLSLTRLGKCNPMQNFCNDLRRPGHHHARAVEEQVAVGECHAPVAHGLQLAPPCVLLQHRQLAQTALQP